MTPEEIEKHFGKDALNMLYDSALQNPVHELVNWIFSLMSEQDIAEWVGVLREDMEQDHDD